MNLSDLYLIQFFCKQLRNVPKDVPLYLTDDFLVVLIPSCNYEKRAPFLVLHYRGKCKITHIKQPQIRHLKIRNNRQCQKGQHHKGGFQFAG